MKFQIVSVLAAFALIAPVLGMPHNDQPHPQKCKPPISLSLSKLLTIFLLNRPPRRMCSCYWDSFFFFCWLDQLCGLIEMGLYVLVALLPSNLSLTCSILKALRITFAAAPTTTTSTSATTTTTTTRSTSEFIERLFFGSQLTNSEQLLQGREVPRSQVLKSGNPPPHLPPMTLISCQSIMKFDYHLHIHWLFRSVVHIMYHVLHTPL